MQIRDRIKSFRRVKAGELLPNPRNWRQHPPEQADAMRGILAEIGFADAVLARETPKGLMLIDGHLRAELAPDAKVPVLVLDVSEAEAEKILLTHDTVTELATVDPAKFQDLLSRAEFEAESLDKMLADYLAENGGEAAAGYEIGENDDELPDTPAEDLQAKWGVQAGDVYEVTGEAGLAHRVMCGDATAEADVAKLLAGETVGLVFTSPPYAQQREYTKESKEHTLDWLGLMCGAFGNLPVRDDTQVLVNIGLIHRDSEWVPYWDGWIEWMRQQGWRRFGWYVWDQGPGMPGDWNGRPAPSHEFVFHFNKLPKQAAKWIDKQAEFVGVTAAGAKRTMRRADGSMQVFTSPEASIQATKIPDSVIRVCRQKGGVGHPAPYPVGLPAFILATWPSDTYDPFLGSGTTVVAAERTSRRAFGMEISPQYVAVTLERLSALGMTVKRAKPATPATLKRNKKALTKTAP